MSLEIIFLYSLPHLQGGNELKVILHSDFFLSQRLQRYDTHLILKKYRLLLGKFSKQRRSQFENYISNTHQEILHGSLLTVI